MISLRIRLRVWIKHRGLMTTDVKDTKDGYEMTMNLPGVKKEDIQAELKDGYLTINAVSNSNKDEKDKDGKYIRGTLQWFLHQNLLRR